MNSVLNNADWLILNVDDQQSIRYAKTRALLRAGFKVLEAGGGLCVATERCKPRGHHLLFEPRVVRGP